jgi:hypothetical protein
MESGFGKKKGQSHTIVRVARLGLASRVGETDQLPDNRPAITSKSVSISIWGSKIPITEFEEDISKFTLPDIFKESLREQISLTVDDMCGDALKQTLIKYAPTTAGQTVVTNGTNVTTATRNVEVQDLRYIHDYMFSGNSGLAAPVPKFRNGTYVGLLSTQAMRGVKNDPEFKDWHAPTSSRLLASGLSSMGVVEGIELFVTNHSNLCEDNVGASTTTGEAIFFGADAAGLLEVRAPEIRTSIPLPDDLGRMRYVGWVGEMEAFHTWETAALFRAVHVNSA